MRIVVHLLVLLLGSAGSSAAQARSSQAPRTRSGQGQRSQTPDRVRLAPKFTSGNVLRYQMEFRTTTEGHRSGLVADPQAPSKLELTWAATVRLELLSAEPNLAKAGAEAPVSTTDPSGAAKAGCPGAKPGNLVRLRATYEKSAATARSDTFDPEGAAIEEQYGKLEGRTLEFTLDAEGKVSEVSGLAEILSDAKARSTAREWLGQLAMSGSLPPEGITPGQKWSSEQAATGAPLASLVWRTESTYLRNERCRPAGSAAAPVADPAVGEACAVILTRFEMVQSRTLRDPTPEDYRQRGLRTAGKWNGSGESLTYVSLRSGWVVSLTQSATEEMDVTVSTSDGASGVRYDGRVRSQSQISLLPSPPVVPR